MKGPGTWTFAKALLTEEPHVCLHRWMHEYGSVYRLKLIKEIYAVNHPEVAKEILKTVHKEVGKKNFIMDRMKRIFGNGIVVSEDELWLQERRILMPSFHKQKVAGYQNAIESILEEFILKWKENDSTTIDITAELRLMMLRIIMSTLTNYDSDEKARSILRLMEKGAHVMSTSLPFNIPNWVPGSSGKQLDSLNRELEILIEEMLEEHSSAIQNNEAGMLSDLHFATDEKGLPLSQRQITDEIKSILLSGVFTTSDAILWTITLLESHPDIKSRLKTSLSSEKEPQLLDNCINEATRLYPPVWSLWYCAKADVVADGTLIPKGSVILFNMYNILRNPEVFSSPDSFQPDRFSDPAFPSGSFIPYGYGARKCIGANLASMIIPIIVDRIYTEFETELNVQLPIEAQILITLTNKQKLNLTLRRK